MLATRREMIGGLAAMAGAATLPSGAFADPALRVVATTGMIADTVRRIVGDAGEVRALMGPGIDPHSYRQTRTDILAIARADLVLWNGLYLEAQMQEVLAEMSRRTTVVAVGEAVPEKLLLGHDDYEDRFDPHVWMVPDLWRFVVERARDALTETAPAQTGVFTENAADLINDLDAVGAYAAKILASVPQEQRVLVTAHDAFNYFGRAYGYDVLGVQGISTESEAGLNRVAELVQTLVNRKVSAVFVESSVSDRSVRALIEGARAKGHEVAIGGELFSDAMGPDGSYEGTYIGMIDHNATVIARALGGDAPVRGWKDELGMGS